LGAKLSAGYQTTGKQKNPSAGFYKDEIEIVLNVDAVFQFCVSYAVTISFGRRTRAKGHRHY
jgi:hypothetical protein